MASIFISYRRTDSDHATGRIYDRLKMRFAAADDRIFMDVEAVPLGVDFVQHLKNEIAGADVVLAVVGPTWASTTDNLGRRRLDQDDDLVRIELATAMAKGIPVIPVFIGDAKMPKAESLPETLRALSTINGIEIRHHQFAADTDKLIQGVEKALVTGSSRPAPVAAEVPTLAFGSSTAPNDQRMPMVPAIIIGALITFLAITALVLQARQNQETAAAIKAEELSAAEIERLTSTFAGKWTDQEGRVFMIGLTSCKNPRVYECSPLEVVWHDDAFNGREVSHYGLKYDVDKKSLSFSIDLRGPGVFAMSRFSTQYVLDLVDGKLVGTMRMSQVHPGTQEVIWSRQ